MQRVIIVKEGEWGMLSTEKGDYDAWLGILQRAVEDAVAESLDGKKLKMATVEVVDTLNEALEKLRNGRIDAIVFNSRGMLDQARKIKREHRNTKVIVFTGLIPDDEVILVDKGWLLDKKQIQRIIL